MTVVTKHAYLILAHNEFDVLRLLIKMLDDERNDIYIHFDRKVDKIPELVVNNSQLYIIDDRIDIRWGHVSLIKAELMLFDRAFLNGPYSYYHMISGTHLPLKGQDEIHDFFSRNQGKSFFVNLCRDSVYQETLKVRRINLFLRNYASKNQSLARLSQFCWKSLIYLQKMFGLKVNKGCSFMKASEWLHLPEAAVKLIIDRKETILHKYRFAFCGDEYFIPSELNDSPLAETMENRNDILYVEMGRSSPRTFNVSELDSLKQTGCLFARKFTI